MKIKLVKYYLNSDTNKNEGIKATIDDEIKFVPLDPANRHYQAIQEWVAEGNTIADAD
jgi:hypothetical protein